MVNYTQSI